LPDRLRAEWPGILQWMVEGCLAWQRDGLTPPEAVTSATADYLESQDAMATWIAEKVAFEPESITKQADLWFDWKMWATSNGEYPGSVREFGEKLQKYYEKQKSVQRTKGNQGQIFKGIKLINSPFNGVQPQETKH
jgi:putative DNA primase/helicase